MNIIQYDASNPILPKGLWWRWYDVRNVPQYSLQEPIFSVRDAAVVLKGVSVVLDGDLILYDCNSQPKHEIVRKGSLAFKFLEGKINPCKAIDLGPVNAGLKKGELTPALTWLPTSPKVEPKFKEGDVVKTKSYIKTSKDLRGVEGVVVSFVGMVGVALLGIEKVRYFQPEEIYHVNLNQKVEPKPVFPVTDLDIKTDLSFKTYYDAFNFSKLRPKGDDIGNVENSAPGSVSVMKMINEVGNHVKAGKNLGTALMKNMSSAVDRELIDKILKADVSGDEAVVKQLEGDIDREIVRLSLKDTQDILDKAAVTPVMPPFYSTPKEFKKVYQGTWVPYSLLYT